jgi:uncharacterized membrane protein
MFPNGMNHVKIILSALAALILAELVPFPGSVMWGINGSKATGLAALAGGLLESLFSPVFWLIAVTIFALFFFASRLNTRLLRITLFWIPTLAVCGTAFAIMSLITYLAIRFRNS